MIDGGWAGVNSRQLRSTTPGAAWWLECSLQASFVPGCLLTARPLVQSLLLKRLILVLVLFATMCGVAVLTYLLHGWPLDDAIYMVVITIFGVGYGEVQPLNSPALRAVTMLLILTSYGSLIAIVGGFVQMVMEGEIARVLNHRRMTKGIEELQGHTILCGYGRAGRILARELADANHQFVLVDVDDAKLSDAESQGFLIVQGNAVDEETLLRAGIERARARWQACWLRTPTTCSSLSLPAN